ncbi:hypothetical protein [Clostridium thermobutyricum]|uniref:hypothetical protein n=1 Tax=Clostridium thermobutyricum TaxID=29372 RepID=UPI0018AA9357|nr:hypothetical protein [Clostridium thermobutyricum]
MGVWINEIKRLIRVFFKNYVVFGFVAGIMLGFTFNNLMVFIPLCGCLGYYYEALYQEKLKKGSK